MYFCVVLCIVCFVTFPVLCVYVYCTTATGWLPISYHINSHMKVVRLSILCTGRLYPPGHIPGTHFCERLSQPQGHSTAGKDYVNEKFQ